MRGGEVRERDFKHRVVAVDAVGDRRFGLVEDEEEPMDIESVLRLVVQRIGTTDFANLVGEDKSNVDKFLRGKRNLKEETLNRYLEPFHLRVKKSLERVA